MKKYDLLCLGLTLVFAVVAGYVNIHASEVQSVVLVVLVSTFILGWLHPRRAWLWGLVIGLAVPLSYLLGPVFGYFIPYPPSPNVFASLIALIPACIGTYGGVLVRKVTTALNSQ